MNALARTACLLAIATSVAGQVPFFQNYFLLKKNEPVQVNVIFQGKAGFVWAGTNRGMFKFDGSAFRRYTTADGLSTDSVTALAQDSLGRIWLGYRNGELAYLQKDRAYKFETREGSAAATVSGILFDRKGNLWFSTLNDGLYYFTQDRLFRLDEDEGLPDMYVYGLAEDEEGNIWAGTDGGVVICSLVDKKVQVRVLNYSNGLPDNIVKRIRTGKDHTMWLATEDAGVIRYDMRSKSFSPILKEKWPYGSISDFVIDGNLIWISCPQAGLVLYDLKTGKTRLFNDDAGASFTSINVLLCDVEGNIWAGTKTGMLRTPGDQLEFIDSFGPAMDINVVALAIDHDEAIWFATREGLFRRRMDASGNPVIERQLVHTPYEKNAVISLYVDTAGYVWAGLYGEGALRIHPASGKITCLNHELRNGNILNISGRGNIVWLATLGGGSEVTINGPALKVRNIGSDAGLSTDYIYQVFMDGRRRVWFGTDGKGVDMLDASGFYHLQKGIESKVVYGFAEDDTGHIWANVQGEGLYWLEGDTFLPFQNQSPFRDNNINGFSSSASGDLVVMHDLGIDIYDVRSKTIRYLGEETGIHDRKANLNAVSKDAQGHLYFGTDAGIIKFSDRTERSKALPEPMITGLKVFDRPKDVGDHLQFGYDENNVTVNFLGLWYQNPQNLTFQYRLENYDRDWITTKDHSVTYSSLPPGSYVFALKVSEGDNFSSATAKSIGFTVAPPFWRTSWFYVLSAIVLAFAGYSFIRYRERALLQDKKILEARVNARTREIQVKNEEIQAQSEAIHAQAEEIKGINENLEGLVRERTKELERKNKSLEEYAFINAHQLRAPVASILGLINLMHKIELKPEEKVYLDHLQKSADKLDDVCSSITKAIEKGDAKY